MTQQHTMKVTTAEGTRVDIPVNAILGMKAAKKGRTRIQVKKTRHQNGRDVLANGDLRTFERKVKELRALQRSNGEAPANGTRVRIPGMATTFVKDARGWKSDGGLLKGHPGRAISNQERKQNAVKHRERKALEAKEKTMDVSNAVVPIQAPQEPSKADPVGEDLSRANGASATAIPMGDASLNDRWMDALIDEQWERARDVVREALSASGEKERLRARIDQLEAQQSAIANRMAQLAEQEARLAREVDEVQAQLEGVVLADKDLWERRRRIVEAALA